jgi:hypothetical protein
MEKPLNISVLVHAMNRLVEEPLEQRLRRIAAHQPMMLSVEA